MTKKLSLKARMGLLLSAATLVAASCTPVLAQPPPSPTPSYTPSTAAVIEPLPSDTPTLSSTNTPILTDTPTLTPTPVPPTYTPTPSSTPTPFSILLRVITDANLRGGPGTVYDRVGGAEEGDVFCPVRYAHGEDGHVWYALDRNSNGYDPGDSWIRDDLVDPNVENIIELLPLIMEISPTPTTVPTATPRPAYLTVENGGSGLYVEECNFFKPDSTAYGTVEINLNDALNCLGDLGHDVPEDIFIGFQVPEGRFTFVDIGEGSGTKYKVFFLNSVVQFFEDKQRSGPLYFVHNHPDKNPPTYADLNADALLEYFLPEDTIRALVVNTDGGVWTFDCPTRQTGLNVATADALYTKHFGGRDQPDYAGYEEAMRRLGVEMRHYENVDDYINSLGSQ